MPRFYNLIGTLSWVATRDVEAADDLNRLWDEATNDLDRMVAAVFLTQYVMAARDIDQGAVLPLDTAKAEVIAACISEKLEAVGHSRGNEDTRPVPPTSWIGVKIDDAESSIGKEGPTWLGVRFRVAAVRDLWSVNPVITPPLPRNVTGPKPKYRKEIEGILAQHDLRVGKAMERGMSPPGRPTAQKIAETLSQRHGRAASGR